MVVDAELNMRLRELIEEGATLSTREDGTFGLAAAAWCDSGLWWGAIWPQNGFDCHIRNCASAKSKPGGIELYDGDGRLVGSVWPMEPDERENFRWAAWQKEVKAKGDFWPDWFERMRQELTWEGED